MVKPAGRAVTSKLTCFSVLSVYCQAILHWPFGCFGRPFCRERVGGLTLRAVWNWGERRLASTLSEEVSWRSSRSGTGRWAARRSAVEASVATMSFRLSASRPRERSMAGPTEAKGEGKCKCLLIGMQGQWVGQPLTIRRLLPSILFFLPWHLEELNSWWVWDSKNGWPPPKRYK